MSNIPKSWDIYQPLLKLPFFSIFVVVSHMFFIRPLAPRSLCVPAAPRSDDVFGRFTNENTSDVSIMGISWEYHGNIMGILWEYYGNIMGILWEYYGSQNNYEYHGNIMGILWELVVLKPQTVVYCIPDGIPASIHCNTLCQIDLKDSLVSIKPILEPTIYANPGRMESVCLFV